MENIESDVIRGYCVLLTHYIRNIDDENPKEVSCSSMKGRKLCGDCNVRPFKPHPSFVPRQRQNGTPPLLFSWCFIYPMPRIKYATNVSTLTRTAQIKNINEALLEDRDANPTAALNTSMKLNAKAK
jgi:hypothetical protein